MEEVRVGLTLSLSGRFAMQGRQALQGLRLWEMRGRARLIVVDDESRTARVREAYRELTTAHVLLGPYGSHLALAAADTVPRRLLWNHGGASDDVQRRPRVVSVLSPSSAYFADLPAWLRRAHPEVRRIDVLHAAAGTFGQRIAEGIAASTDLPVRVDSIDAAAVCDGETVAAVTESLRDDTTATVLAASFDEEIRLLRSRPRTGVIAAVSAGVEEFATALGPLSEGVIGPSQWEPSAHAVQLGPSSEAFVKSCGGRPDYPAAAAFATGLILEECLRRAGSLDEDALYEAALSLETTTLFGPFALDSTGRQIGHRMRLVQWRGGVKQLLDQ